MNADMELIRLKRESDIVSLASLIVSFILVFLCLKSTEVNDTLGIAIAGIGSAVHTAVMVYTKTGIQKEARAWIDYKVKQEGEKTV